MQNDTIVAVATPPGQGGVAIVRISGPRAEEILQGVFSSKGKEETAQFRSHRLVLGWVGAPRQPVDEAMAVLMRAPHSYTREDVAEIHCHGAPWTVRETVRLVVEAGARPAEPGEFTRRAFENGRIDLAQAEAVMALIGAQGERAARDALQQMRGGSSRIALEARAEIVRMLAGLEAALDFPEEFEAADERAITGGLRGDAKALAASLRARCNPRAEKLLREGFEVVLAGRPNVGKSTLLNALLGEERAIVADLPGTTRDTLTEKLELDGYIVQLTDTAGLRGGDAEPAAYADVVEAMGADRARAALARADLQLIVLDASAGLGPQDEALLIESSGRPRIVALNKSDRRMAVEAEQVKALLDAAQEQPTPTRIVTLSARTGQGLDALLDALLEAVRAQTALSDAAQATLTRARHIAAATRAAEALEDAVTALDAGLPADVAAIDLRRALEALGGITGETLSEDVIDAIFANFCVGK